MRTLIIGVLATSTVACVLCLNLVAWPRYESERAATITLSIPPASPPGGRQPSRPPSPAAAPASATPDAPSDTGDAGTAPDRDDVGPAPAVAPVVDAGPTRDAATLVAAAPVMDAGPTQEAADAGRTGVDSGVSSTAPPEPFGDIRFLSGSVLLGPTATRRVAQIAALMRARPSLRVELRGHTDARGDPDRNMSISVARAATVARRLVELGVEEERIHYDGAGGREPLDRRRNENAARRNRRVQVMWR